MTGLPRGPLPIDVWQRLGELAPQAHDNVRDQHLNSQALLREFTGVWPGRQGPTLMSMNLDYPHAPARPAGTKGCGYEPDVPTYASASAEKL